MVVRKGRKQEKNIRKVKENLKKMSKNRKGDRIRDTPFVMLDYENEGCEIMNEILKEIRVSAPSLVCVCIDRMQDENLEGRLYHKYQSDAVHFQSVSALLNEMENLFDRIGFPQSSTRQRTFSTLDPRTERQKEAVQVADTKDILSNSGDKATFIVHVRYRQNATWQGDILWAEKKKKLFFRSALELLKLIDSALDEEGIEEIDICTDSDEKRQKENKKGEHIHAAKKKTIN